MYFNLWGNIMFYSEQLKGIIKLPLRQIKIYCRVILCNEEIFYYSKSKIIVGFILQVWFKKKKICTLLLSFGKFLFTLSKIRKKIVYFGLFLSVKGKLSSQNPEPFKDFLAKELSIFTTSSLEGQHEFRVIEVSLHV